MAFFCRDTIKCDIREDIPKSNLEILSAQITPPRASPFIILSWYRPPNEPFETFDKIEQVLRFIEAERKEIILLGDINCDFSTETAGTNQSKSPVPGHIKRLKDIYQSSGLKQLITEPTRETENTSTIIDHFHFISFKSYLKLVFTIVDNKILIHTNYLQKRYTLYKRKNH